MDDGQLFHEATVKYEVPRLSLQLRRERIPLMPIMPKAIMTLVTMA